jgi:glucose/arabinose dehydrogenase
VAERSPIRPSASGRATLRSAAGALAVAFVLLAVAASCTIKTEDESASTTTLAPPSVGITAPVASDTVAPGDTTPPRNLDTIAVELEELAEVDQPTAITTRMGSESIYIAERAGRVRELTREFRRNRDGIPVLDRLQMQRTPVLDISDDVGSDEPQQGLLGVAFSTDGARLYVSYTNLDGNLVVDRFKVADGKVDGRSRVQMLLIEMFTAENIGGQIALGTDGFLYIAVGDGGGDGDPSGAAQDRAALTGSVLRIDPDGGNEDEPYVVPLGNPYFDDLDAAPEVWLKGVRNPTLSFDPETGDLWSVDRGQDTVEEVNWMPADDGAGKGKNLGWAEMEGRSERSGGSAPENHSPPAFEYGRDQGCAAVGGQLYRGQGVPELYGAYLMGDFCTGQLRALLPVPGGISQERRLDVGLPPEQLRGFGVDPDGEILLFTAPGTIFAVRAVPPPE